jgi:hypothetical protein
VLIVPPERCFAIHLFCDGCRKKFEYMQQPENRSICPRRDGHRETVLLRDAHERGRFIQYTSKKMFSGAWPCQLCQCDANAAVDKGELSVNRRSFFIYDGCVIMWRATWNMPARAAAYAARELQKRIVPERRRSAPARGHCPPRWRASPSRSADAATAK